MPEKGLFRAIFVHKKREPPLRFSLRESAVLNVPENDQLAFINDLLDLPYGHIKFFCKALVCDSIKQPALQNAPVPFVQDPFVDRRLDLTSG